MAGKLRIVATERTAEALELRKAGHSYAAIAAKLGYSNQGAAYKAVKRALDRTLQEPADELRRVEVERLDDLLAGLWDKAKGGNLWAVDRALAIMQRRAELLGLDAKPAEPVDERPYAGLSDDDLNREIAAAVESIRLRQALPIIAGTALALEPA